MSKASREWKASCKEANRYDGGWLRKDMTLRSYMAMKREDQRMYKPRNMIHIKKAIAELDAGKGIEFNPFEDMAMVEHDGISHLTAISGDVGTITTTGGDDDRGRNDGTALHASGQGRERCIA